MDPAVYARAFGVQSEANKVTVTRVACGEILYRRVVNTFRRDMNSTVTHIRREQKKLRRCMRGYRKKLYGDEKKKLKPYKFGWIANTSADDDGDIRDHDNSQGRLQSLQTGQVPENASYSHQNNERRSDAKSRSFSQNEPLQEQVRAFLKASNIKPRKKSERHEDVVNKNKKGRGLYGKERRRFVIGSGKIPSSKRVVDDVFQGEEEEADSYSLLSDSSDDEGSPGDLVEAKEDMQKTNYDKRLRNVQRGLIRANSAYFKPISMSDNDTSHPVPDENPAIGLSLHPHNLHQDSDETKVQDASYKTIDDENNVPGTQDPRSKTEDSPPDSFSKTLLPPVLPISRSIEETDDLSAKSGGAKAGTGEDIPITPRNRNDRKKGVSFGDIAKLQHGLKTKKLFSLVDQLASRHGIVGDEINVNKSEKGPDIKSLHNRYFNKNTTGNLNKSFTAYSSVFYNIKYGYGHDMIESPNKESDISRSSNSKVKNESFNTHLSTTETGLESELTQTLSTRLSHTDINESRFDESSTDLNDDSSLFPPQQNTSKRNSRMLSTNETVCQRSLAQDETDSANQDLHVLQRRRDSRLQRQRRKSSMLEASQYVNSLRSKETKKRISFSNNAGSLNKRRDSAMSSDDNEMMPDIHKVSWSSALSRMKLVHTLVDLTHII